MPITKSALERAYNLEYEVGLWTFGTVQVLREKDSGTLKTCKIVPKSLIGRSNSVASRLEQLKGIRHTHIAGVTDIIEDSNDVFIISEFCGGGDVGDWMDQLEEGHGLQEQTVAAYIRQAIIALNCSHPHGIFHRDLQPSNLLLTSRLPDAQVKVSDIGLAAILDPDNAVIQRSPNPYVAPEVLSSSDPAYPSSDIWSLGAIAHALLVGRPPQREEATGALAWLSRLRGSQADEDAWSERSEVSRDFVRRMLRPEGERMTISKALQHPFVKGLTPITGMPFNADNELARDVRHKTLCYMLAVLLVPVVLPYRDFEQLRQAFVDSDRDRDGFNSSQAVQRILLGRCSLNEAVVAALAIADIGKTDVLDLCTATCADVIAREFFAAGPTSQPLAGPFRASDLVPRMVKRFFNVFGERKQPQTSVASIRTRLRTATLNDMEKYAGVSYDEILECFDDRRPIDSQVLPQQLSANAGRGTPLDPSSDSFSPAPGDRGPWGLFPFPSFFQSCGTDSVARDESPYPIDTVN